MPAPPPLYPLYPPSRRLAALLRARRWDAPALARAAGLPLPRIGAALHGATCDPHLIAERLALSVGAVLAVRGNPAGPHTLPLRTVIAILDGAPPTARELARIAAVFGFSGADALNDACCPRCALVSSLVQPGLCWGCGWRIVFPAPQEAA